MIYVASIIWISGILNIDAMAWFNKLSALKMTSLLLVITLLGIFSPQLENELRVISGKKPLVMPGTYKHVRFQLENKCKDIPKGSRFIVQGYTSLDYWVSFIRPDIVVIPYGVRKYCEAERDFDSYKGIYVSSAVPDSFINSLGRAYTPIDACLP